MIKCKNCGRVTHQMVCGDGKCYAAYVNGRWVKGCEYHNASPQDRLRVNELINPVKGTYHSE